MISARPTYCAVKYLFLDLHRAFVYTLLSQITGSLKLRAVTQENTALEGNKFLLGGEEMHATSTSDLISILGLFVCLIVRNCNIVSILLYFLWCEVFCF